MAIEFRKDLFADERDDDLNEIGKPTQRQDMLGHVTGRSPFYDDHLFDGLCHIRCARSPHHHARIRRVDTSAAERMPGVRRVITARDVPHNLNTLLSLLDFGLDDEELIASERVAYKGEPVAAVIADTERQAREACRAVRVDWEALPHVLDVEEAIKPGAPAVNPAYPGNLFVYHGKYDHQKLRYGDVEAALRTADHVVTGRYQMSPIEQAPIETCGAIAAPETNDRFVCYTSTQALFFSLGTAVKLLDVSSARLHFIGGTVGGGFGGKVDSLHEPMAILGTMLTGRPCKYMFDREEEMQVGAPRGAERWYLTDGVMNDGRIVARKFVGYFDAGATTRLSSYAIIKGVGHLPGPYTIPNVYADVYCVFTNRTPATAMRGFGVTGVDFAIESHMDEVADTIGMDPIELRILNAYRDGDMKAHRRLAKNTALVECCQVAAGKAGWGLSQAARAASSLTGGGGARAELPAFTATDEHGRVAGFSSGSYAQGGRPAEPTGRGDPRPAPGSAPRPEPRHEPPRHEPPRHEPSRTPEPRREPAYAGAPPRPEPPSPAPPAPGEPPRRAPTRFSSISGLRRR
ncbi:xanthine dehydrogenase family protein molybdopterin-binding subunit [Acuticoccus mangrovi]|uniref:Xanthine dehydrogenase family protein molybdopterin-binding subunit n=1 Tax=Acuticoccus mangrovi TaxID=2796142 RepID=A0A934IPF2_9HYPH|nr:molybdopterin cofactor-binding domain-containing protein [Acuticoccus mangrovi]MBJ3775179.1 xanthine dehydrogenase family protein molybdopterin-binding subunit [Acuticoccus mangrovi]